MDDRHAKMITVQIAGRPYSLKIQAHDEVAIRKLVREINEKVNRFQIAYPSKDKQDCLALVALTYAAELHRQMQTGASDALLQKLARIDSLLDQLLTS